MSANYTPANTNDFFSPPDKEVLFQGDIVYSRECGLKDTDDDHYPDYYMIITKTCDLSFDKQLSKITRAEVINLLPCQALEIWNKIFKTHSNASLAFPKIINLLSLTSVFRELSNKNIIDNMIKDKISKFMFIPPDGRILKEPMILDFDLLNTIDGDDEKRVRELLNSKKLQLCSPFREKVAQRFGLHYMSIGMNDYSIRDEFYRRNIRNNFK